MGSNQTSFEQVADESPQISEWKIPVNTQPPPVAQKSIKPLSWAEMVAISKAVEVEKVEASEPVKSRTTKTPVLVVVGEVDDLQSVPVVPSDPSEFTECVGRNERRRRKWRSSYSESCEFSTDGEECSNQPESNAESIPSETKMVTEPEEVQVEPIQSDPVVEPSTNQTCSSEFQPTAKVSFDDDIQTENVKSEEMHSSVKPKKVQTKIEKETKEVERKRQRSRLSESEKEALALAEAIESGDPPIPSHVNSVLMEKNVPINLNLTQNLFHQKLKWSLNQKRYRWNQSNQTPSSNRQQTKHVAQNSNLPLRYHLMMISRQKM